MPTARTAPFHPGNCKFSPGRGMSGIRTPDVRPLPLYGPLVTAALITTEVKPMRTYTVSDVARQHGVRPRDISDLFYNRELSDKKCPVVGGRRLIPPEY